jgi:hypothetical protein
MLRQCLKFDRNKSILAVGILLRLFVDSPTHQQLDRNPLKTLPFLTLNQILLLWVVASSSPAHEYQAVHKVEKRLDPFLSSARFIPHSDRPFFSPSTFRFPVNLLSCVEYQKERQTVAKEKTQKESTQKKLKKRNGINSPNHFRHNVSCPPF